METTQEAGLEAAGDIPGYLCGRWMCASKEEVWAGLVLGARGMRNGSHAHPGGAVMIRTCRGLIVVIELQFALVSLGTSIWVGFPGLTHPM
jgi:hypothetical protein